MAKQRELGVVIVGCGSMANRWVKVTKDVPGTRIVGLVDVRREAAEAMAARHELPSDLVFDTLKQAIAATRPDAVFDVTIPAAHHKVTIEALRSGCHVLGEKPMSDSLPTARRMVAEAKKARRLYAVTQTRRPTPQMMTIRQFLAGGAIGRVEEAHCDFYLGPHFGGFRDEMDDVLLLDMAIHTFDQARMLTGADPVSVYCHSFNPKRSWYKGDACAVAIFEMRTPRGDVVFTYRGSWCAQGLPTSWESQWRIVADKGTLLWDGHRDIRAQSVKKNAKPGFQYDVEDLPIEPVTLERSSHEYLIHDFIDCVRRGGKRKPMCPCEDNIKSLAMVLAAVKSAHTGKVQKVVW
jgi:predicted dehydrogenase